MTGSTVSPDIKWRAISGDDIVWAEWDGEYIAFHRPSSNTHLLNDVSKTLLTQILNRPKTTSEIVDALMAEFAGEGDSKYAAKVTAMLNHFVQLGLVERT